VTGAELRRVLSHPVRDQGTLPPLPPILKRWSEHLWPVQVEALATLYHQTPPLGIYGDIGVGGGKFLIATLAGAVLGARKPVVLTQPDLIRQAHFELDAFRQLFPELEDHLPEYVAYSTLSQSKHTDLLHRLSPDVLVLDEAHAVASRDSARGLRLREYVISNPDTRVVVLSGTLNKKSLLDVYDLAELALRDTTWLPLTDPVQEAWASILDHGAKPSDKIRKQFLQPMVKWAAKRGVDVGGPDEEVYQRAYRERYLTTPGVIAPKETSVGASLVLHTWRPKTPQLIREAIKHLDETWELPDGTELVDALEYWRHAGTLSLGFYYRPIYRGEVDRLEEWQETRLEWTRAVRRQIKYIRRPGVDSPANVVRACESGTAHPDVIRAYWAWMSIRDKVEQDSEPVWVTQDLIDLAADRARAMGRGILWYESSTALEPVLKERGFCTYGAGSNAPTPDVKIPALSRLVHGTGKNLQAWDNQLILEPPASATPWEQLLGRSHRPGQLSDTVRAEILASTWITRSRIYSAMAEAEYVGRTSNKKHKLTFCDWA